MQLDRGKSTRLRESISLFLRLSRVKVELADSSDPKFSLVLCSRTWVRNSEIVELAASSLRLMSAAVFWL